MNLPFFNWICNVWKTQSRRRMWINLDNLALFIRTTMKDGIFSWIYRIFFRCCRCGFELRNEGRLNRFFKRGGENFTAKWVFFSNHPDLTKLHPHPIIFIPNPNQHRHPSIHPSTCSAPRNRCMTRMKKTQAEERETERRQRKNATTHLVFLSSHAMTYPFFL